MAISSKPRKVRRVTEGVVLVCPDGEYIEDTDGNWGPRYHSRASLSDATVFEPSEVREVRRHWGEPLFERKVRVTEIVEEI